MCEGIVENVLEDAKSLLDEFGYCALCKKDEALRSGLNFRTPFEIIYEREVKIPWEVMEVRSPFIRPSIREKNRFWKYACSQTQKTKLSQTVTPTYKPSNSELNNLINVRELHNSGSAGIKLNISYLNVGDELFHKKISFEIGKVSTIVCLDLCSCGLTYRSVERLVEILKKGCNSIRTLSLNNNSIGPRGAIALAEYLAIDNPSGFRYNSHMIEDGSPLGAKIYNYYPYEYNKTELTPVTYNALNIPQKVYIPPEKALFSLPYIKDVSETSVFKKKKGKNNDPYESGKSQTAHHIFAGSLGSNMASTNVNSAMSPPVMPHYECPLESLSISYCDIGDAGVVAITNALRHVPGTVCNLIFLNLRGNGITNLGAFAVLDMLVDHYKIVSEILPSSNRMKLKLMKNALSTKKVYISKQKVNAKILSAKGTVIASPIPSYLRGDLDNIVEENRLRCYNTSDVNTSTSDAEEVLPIPSRNDIREQAELLISGEYWLRRSLFGVLVPSTFSLKSTDVSIESIEDMLRQENEMMTILRKQRGITISRRKKDTAPHVIRHRAIVILQLFKFHLDTFFFFLSPVKGKENARETMFHHFWETLPIEARMQYLNFNFVERKNENKLINPLLKRAFDLLSCKQWESNACEFPKVEETNKLTDGYFYPFVMKRYGYIYTWLGSSLHSFSESSNMWPNREAHILAGCAIASSFQFLQGMLWEAILSPSEYSSGFGEFRHSLKSMNKFIIIMKYLKDEDRNVLDNLVKKHCACNKMRVEDWYSLCKTRCKTYMKREEKPITADELTQTYSRYRNDINMFLSDRVPWSNDDRPDNEPVFLDNTVVCFDNTTRSTALKEGADAELDAAEEHDDAVTRAILGMQAAHHSSGISASMHERRMNKRLSSLENSMIELKPRRDSQKSPPSVPDSLPCELALSRYHGTQDGWKEIAEDPFTSSFSELGRFTKAYPKRHSDARDLVFPNWELWKSQNEKMLVQLLPSPQQKTEAPLEVSFQPTTLNQTTGSLLRRAAAPNVNYLAATGKFAITSAKNPMPMRRKVDKHLLLAQTYFNTYIEKALFSALLGADEEDQKSSLSSREASAPTRLKRIGARAMTGERHHHLSTSFQVQCSMRQCRALGVPPPLGLPFTTIEEQQPEGLRLFLKYHHYIHTCQEITPLYQGKPRGWIRGDITTSVDDVINKEKRCPLPAVTYNGDLDNDNTQEEERDKDKNFWEELLKKVKKNTKEKNEEASSTITDSLLENEQHNDVENLNMESLFKLAKLFLPLARNLMSCQKSYWYALVDPLSAFLRGREHIYEHDTPIKEIISANNCTIPLSKMAISTAQALAVLLAYNALNTNKTTEGERKVKMLGGTSNEGSTAVLSATSSSFYSSLYTRHTATQPLSSSLPLPLQEEAVPLSEGEGESLSTVGHEENTPEPDPNTILLATILSTLHYSQFGEDNEGKVKKSLIVTRNQSLKGVWLLGANDELIGNQGGPLINNVDPLLLSLIDVALKCRESLPPEGLNKRVLRGIIQERAEDTT